MAVLPPDWLGHGYGTAASVTQTTSRTTAVQIDKLSGNIKLVSAAGSSTPAVFQVNNNKVHKDDMILLCQQSGTDPYALDVVAVADGSFKIAFRTLSGTTTEQPVFSFMVIKNNVPTP